MDFTEKKFHYLPARESQHKEAPYPKHKKAEPKKENDPYISATDTDPVWLKDKGDHFYKRYDFLAAISAYSKSLEKDKDLFMARLNRATVFMRMRTFQAAIEEFNVLEQQLKALDSKEVEGDQLFYDKMLARTYLKRGAANAWLSQFDAAIADYKQAIEYPAVFGKE